MNTFDVGVIGAGIHGVSAAFHLAQRGVRTVLFDKGAPGGGPTGRSSAVCRAYYTNSFLAGVARDSLGMFERFDELTGGRDAGYRRTGVLFLHPEADVEPLRESTSRLARLGIDTELLGGDDLAREFPQFELDDIAIGVWEPGGGYADPAGTTIGMFERALELGLDSRLWNQVCGLAPAPGGGAVVSTANGDRVACRRVLVAAGPWTRPLLALLGVDLPLTVERHIVATYEWGASKPIPFGFADLVGGYYSKPEGEDLFCLGPLHEAPTVDPDDFAEEITDEESLTLAQAVVRRAPSLESSVARGGWASLYDVSPDWQPVIGEVAEGVFVDAGTSGHGFKLAPALGAHVADLVTGGEVDPGLEQFSPRRFDDGHVLAGGYGNVRILG